MAVSSKVEEIILEISRVAGKIYESNTSGIGDVDTPNSAIFEINNLFNTAAYGLPYFGVIETSPLGFQIYYDVINDQFNVTIDSGQVSYQNSIIQVPQQKIPLKKDFSKNYVSGLNYLYGITVGFPLSEAQKVNSVWETIVTTAAGVGDTQIYISDTSIPSTLGFPLEAHVGNTYLRFTGYNSDKTAIIIDPSLKLGTYFGRLNTSLAVNTPVRFIVTPRLRYITGYPLISTSNASNFDFFPPIPNDWLPIAKILVMNPQDPEVAGVNNDQFIRTAYDLPTSDSNNPILGNSDDVGVVLDACDAAINDLSALSNTVQITPIIQGLRLFTSKKDSNLTFNEFWSKQPFRPTSYFSKGISFSGLEKFQFPYSFAKAHYNLTGIDVQHIFATFRGDLITYNSTLMGSNQVSSSSLSSNVINSSSYLSSLDTGTQIYGVSVVSNISLTEYGESIPVYTSLISSDTTNTNYMVELTWASTGITNPMFYHVYKRPKLSSELVERKLTNVSEISYTPTNTLTPITDTTNYRITNKYLAQLITPNENCYTGGVSFKMGFLNTGATVYNPADTIKIYICDSYFSAPLVSSKVTSEETFRFGELMDGTSNEFTVKFRQGANLTTTKTYFLVFETENDLYTSATTIEPYYTRTISSTYNLYSSPNASVWTNLNSKMYFDLKGYIDNGSIAGESIRRGVQLTNRIAFEPKRLSVYVPPVESLSGNMGLRFDGSTIGIASTTDTSIKNELIVTVTARNGENGTPQTFTTIVPKGAVRDTRYMIGSSTDLFDRVDDVYVSPGTNLTRNNNGPILWDVYDLITVETVP